MVLEVIQREVPIRGIGYLILRDCPEDRLGDALNRGMEKLKKAGAKSVLATSLPEGEPLHDGPVGVWRLTHAYDLVRLERSLAGKPKAEEKLTLRPLKRATDDKLYAELMNRALALVPNARTLSPSELRRPNCRTGLAYRGEQLVGAYQIDLNEKIPELAALAIEPQLWRQGLGRSLLRTMLNSMGRAPLCGLAVPTANLPALSLFQSEGFTQTGVISSWFEVM